MSPSEVAQNAAVTKASAGGASSSSSSLNPQATNTQSHATALSIPLPREQAPKKKSQKTYTHISGSRIRGRGVTGGSWRFTLFFSTYYVSICGSGGMYLLDGLFDLVG
ncbi:hypothetical protein BDW42DRAFT_134092 [Aspergillus taichungensis]|uniref:Uncharacterized protein n=1 Tax=Aspergillus taichungensis TaxID=482145 RepID=A0A2J5HPH2_9EURO|nr:hypothetical protein BDW42DRAFT_134092 [Aspergillus taichungensis]